MLLGAPALSQNFPFPWCTSYLLIAPTKKMTGQITLVKMAEEAQQAQGQKHINH